MKKKTVPNITIKEEGLIDYIERCESVIDISKIDRSATYEVTPRIKILVSSLDESQLRTFAVYLSLKKELKGHELDSETRRYRDMFLKMLLATIHPVSIIHEV